MGILTDIRAGLAANLAAITDLQFAPGGQAYMLASPSGPAAHIYPGGGAGPIEYDQAMQRGMDRVPFTVQVMVPLTSDIGAQADLDAYIEPSGSRSVKEALESDRTLGGAADGLRVVSCTGYQQFAFEGRPTLLGAEWHVDVYATGT